MDEFEQLAEAAWREYSKDMDFSYANGLLYEPIHNAFVAGFVQGDDFGFAEGVVMGEDAVENEEFQPGQN